LLRSVHGFRFEAPCRQRHCAAQRRRRSGLCPEAAGVANRTGNGRSQLLPGGQCESCDSNPPQDGTCRFLPKRGRHGIDSNHWRKGRLPCIRASAAWTTMIVASFAHFARRVSNREIAPEPGCSSAMIDREISRKGDRDVDHWQASQSRRPLRRRSAGPRHPHGPFGRRDKDARRRPSLCSFPLRPQAAGRNLWFTRMPPLQEAGSCFVGIHVQCRRLVNVHRIQPPELSANGPVGTSRSEILPEAFATFSKHVILA